MKPTGIPSSHSKVPKGWPQANLRLVARATLVISLPPGPITTVQFLLDRQGGESEELMPPLEVLEVFIFSAEVVDSTDAVVIAIEAGQDGRPGQEENMEYSI